MSKFQVRILFGFLVFFSLTTFAIFSLTGKEPYPALIFPGFGKMPATNNNVTSTIHEFKVYYNDGSQEIFNSQKILISVPPSFQPFLLKKIYAKAERGDTLGQKEFCLSVKERLSALSDKKPILFSILKETILFNGQVTGNKEKTEEREIILFSL